MSLRYKRLYLDSPSVERPDEGDAGYDLRAYHNVLLNNHSPAPVDTGIAIEIPIGFVGLIFPRSGLRFNHGVSTHGTGVIDSTYRGEIRIQLMHSALNSSSYGYMIKAGDKIAQLVIVPCFTDDVEEVEELTTTARGNKGFGSTGK